MAQTIRKTIYLATNFNNKLACESFIHIDEAPRERIPEQKLKETIIEIRTNDNSHPPVLVQLIDLLRIPLSDLTTTMTLPSHNMEWFDFAKWKIEQHPKTKTTQPMAVYYYKKVTL